MWLLRRIGWLFYQLSIAAGMALAAPFLLVRRGRHYLVTLAGRFGLHRGPSFADGDGSKHRRLWIHAVSVGEVAIAATLIRKLPEDLPLVVTTVTPTGQARAQALLADSGDHRVAAYLPFDLGFAVSTFFRRFKPSALILVEGDYWPLVLESARRRGVPVAVINGRVGERSGRRLARFPRLARRLFFDSVSRFAVQTVEDRRRLIAAGASPERIRVTGNLKFDASEPRPLPELEAEIRRLADGRSILLAGSTMPGEEEQLLDAFAAIGAGSRALLLIAPRHPERFDAVARLIRERGLTLLRRSLLAVGEAGDELRAASEAVDVILLDSLGELAGLYRVADSAFIGGTLVPTGGHNPLEPACFAVPTVVGPSMHNFREMAEIFDRAGAWARVADSAALARLWQTWLEDPQAAREVGQAAEELLAANRGALERTLEVIEPILPE